MPGQSSIRPTRNSDKKTTKRLPNREIMADEMLPSTSTGAASTTSFESETLMWRSHELLADWREPTDVDQITQILNAGGELSSTAGHQNAWRFPYLLDIFNSCYHRWVSRRD